jgi:lambda repressor-like predicted transcriptional regulator
VHPEQIKAAMRMRGYTQAKFAEELGVHTSTLSQVIAGYGKSARIQSAIAALLNKTVKELWPNQTVLRRPHARANSPAEIAGN